MIVNLNSISFLYLRKKSGQSGKRSTSASSAASARSARKQNYGKFCILIKWWNKFNLQFIGSVITVISRAVCWIPLAFGICPSPCCVTVNTNGILVSVEKSSRTFLKLWFISADVSGCVVVWCLQCCSCPQGPKWPHCRQHKILTSGVCWWSVWRLKTFLQRPQNLKTLWKKKNEH